MIPPEDKGAKVYGVTLALICLVIIFIGKIVFWPWQKLVVPVIEQFKELGRDLKTIMKGG